MGKLDEVLTISEVSKLTGLATSTIRTRLQKGTINKKFFRKTEEGVYLFSRKFVEDELKNKT